MVFLRLTPSSSKRLPEKLQFLGDRCFATLIAKGRGTDVSLHSCQDGYTTDIYCDEGLRELQPQGGEVIRLCLRGFYMQMLEASWDSHQL